MRSRRTAREKSYKSMLTRIGSERYRHIRELIKSVKEYVAYINEDFQNRENVLGKFLK